MHPPTPKDIDLPTLAWTQANYCKYDRRRNRPDLQLLCVSCHAKWHMSRTCTCKVECGREPRSLPTIACNATSVTHATTMLACMHVHKRRCPQGLSVVCSERSTGYIPICSTHANDSVSSLPVVRPYIAEPSAWQRQAGNSTVLRQGGWA